jgi:Domain of unknown function (DUF3786)
VTASKPPDSTDGAARPAAGAVPPPEAPAGEGLPLPMGTTPRFQKALDKALADWAAADPARCAALAGCEAVPGGVLVPFFGQPHLVSHPEGRVVPLSDEAARAAASGGASAAPSDPPPKPVHVSIVILLLHYLLTADATPPADSWAQFRDIPGGMFYAQAFEAHTGPPLGRLVADVDPDAFAEHVGAFRAAGARITGVDLDLGDAAQRFQALPRLPVAALLWAGDDEFPGRAAILFDGHAHHYLPIEDLSGMGEWLAHKLARG